MAASLMSAWERAEKSMKHADQQIIAQRQLIQEESWRAWDQGKNPIQREAAEHRLRQMMSLRVHLNSAADLYYQAGHQFDQIAESPAHSGQDQQLAARLAERMHGRVTYLIELNKAHEKAGLQTAPSWHALDRDLHERLPKIRAEVQESVPGKVTKAASLESLAKLTPPAPEEWTDPTAQLPQVQAYAEALERLREINMAANPWEVNEPHPGAGIAAEINQRMDPMQQGLSRSWKTLTHKAYAQAPPAIKKYITHDETFKDPLLSEARAAAARFHPEAASDTVDRAAQLRGIPPLPVAYTPEQLGYQVSHDVAFDRQLDALKAAEKRVQQQETQAQLRMNAPGVGTSAAGPSAGPEIS
ncbi:hypothetical protein [Nesterenkonia alkaliphila]|uniref:Uncharacterized protein n=1 Tax=Nesterenkonia alkaliphila TaxID=1463631 RepID=A0A7K1UGY1_9MICC|nr:hypothetical protein [Nesterenkonia alkaliphila]MVT25737.1 hypothetical protein [Nesterenkonia alkaliphila]GFZ85450.1 hypothetical protein GCM10011359_13240 [Nesterenkonia alkaliphila]